MQNWEDMPFQMRVKFKKTVQIRELSDNDDFEHIQISDDMIAILKADPAPGKSDYTDFILNLKISKKHEETPLARRKYRLSAPGSLVRLGSLKKGMMHESTDSHQKESKVAARDESHHYQRDDSISVPSSSGQRGSDSKSRRTSRIQNSDSAKVKEKRKEGLSLDELKMGFDFRKKHRAAKPVLENTNAIAIVKTESEKTLPIATTTTLSKSTSSMIANVTRDDPTSIKISSKGSKGNRTDIGKENGTSKGNKTCKQVESKAAKPDSHGKKIVVKAIVHAQQNADVVTQEDVGQQITSSLAVQDKHVSGTEESKSSGYTSSGFSASTSVSTKVCSQERCIRKPHRKGVLKCKDSVEFSREEKDKFSVSQENSMWSDSSYSHEVNQGLDAHSTPSRTTSYKTNLNVPLKRGPKLQQRKSKIKERKLAISKESRSRKNMIMGKNSKTGKEASSKLARQTEGIRRIISKFIKNRTAKKNVTLKSEDTFTARGLKAVNVGSSSRFAQRFELENSKPRDNTVRSKSLEERQAVAVAGTSSEIKKGSVIISPPANQVTFTSTNSILLSNVVHDGIRELVGKGQSHIYVLVDPPEKMTFRNYASSEKIAFRVDTGSCPFELFPVKTRKVTVTQSATNSRASCNAVEKSVHPGADKHIEQVPLPSQSYELTSRSLAAHGFRHTLPSDDANTEIGLGACENGKVFSHQPETFSCLPSVNETPDVSGNQSIPLKPSECSVLSKSLSWNTGFLRDSTLQTSVSEQKPAAVVQFIKKPGKCTPISQESVNNSCSTSLPVQSTNEVVTTVSSVITSYTVHDAKNYVANALEDRGIQSQKKSPGKSDQTFAAPSAGASTQIQIGLSQDSRVRSQKVCAFSTSMKSETAPSFERSKCSESVPSENTDNQTGKVRLETSKQNEAALPEDTTNVIQTVTSLDKYSKTDTDCLVDINDKPQQTVNLPSTCRQTKTISSMDICDQSQTETVSSMNNCVQSYTVPSVDTSDQSHTVASMDTNVQLHTVASMDTNIQLHPVASMDTIDQSHTVASVDTNVQSHTVPSMDTSVQSHTVASLDTSDQSHPVASIDTSDQLHPVASMDLCVQSHTVASLDPSDAASSLDKSNEVALSSANDNSANSTPKAASPSVSQHVCRAKSVVTIKSSSAQSGIEVNMVSPKTSVASSQTKESTDCSSLTSSNTSVLCKTVNVQQKQCGLTSKSYQTILPRNMIFMDSNQFSMDANTKTFVLSSDGKLFPMLRQVGSANISQNAFPPLSMKTISPIWQPQGLRTILPKPSETCGKVQHETAPKLSQSFPEAETNKSRTGAGRRRLFNRTSVTKKLGSKSLQGQKTTVDRKSSVFKKSSSRKSDAKCSRRRITAPHSKSAVLNLLPLSNCGSSQIASSPSVPTGPHDGDVKRGDAEEISIRSNPADCDTRNSLHDSTRKQGTEGGGEDSVTSTDSDSFDSSLAHWTCSDVARYLAHHGLDKLIPGFQNIDGMCMVEMVRWYITSSDVLSKYLYDLGCNLQENLKMCSLLSSLRCHTSLDQPASTSASSIDN